MAKKKWTEVREAVLAKAGSKLGKRTEVVAAPAAQLKTSSILHTYVDKPYGRKNA